MAFSEENRGRPVKLGARRGRVKAAREPALVRPSGRHVRATGVCRPDTPGVVLGAVGQGRPAVRGRRALHGDWKYTTPIRGDS